MVKKKAMCSLQTNVPGADIGMIKIRELHDFKEHPFKVVSIPGHFPSPVRR